MNSKQFHQIGILEKNARIYLGLRVGAITNPDEMWRLCFDEKILPPGTRLDLSEADLYGYLFVGPWNDDSPLYRADFRKTILIRTKWLGSNISGCDFTGADLRGSEMHDVKAESVSFRCANLQDTFLELNPSEEMIDFSGANLTDAILSVSGVSKYDFTDTIVNGLTLELHGIQEELKHVGDSFLSYLNEQQRQNVTIKEERKKKCFIATAIYGSESHPDVVLLRCFRDYVLATTKIGRKLIIVYELLSPKIADFISAKRFLRPLGRFLISPLIVSARCVLKVEGGRRGCRRY